MQSIPAIEVPQQVDEQIQSWDCSFKDLDTSDYVVGQAVGAIGARVFWATKSADGWTAQATVKAVREMTAKWPRQWPT